MKMRTIDEVINDCAEIARDKKAAAEYFKHKFGETKGWLELQKDADEHEQLVKWLRELRRLRKKDEPRLMRFEYDGFADGNPVTDTAYCPSCKHEFEEESENWTCDFCPNCGQRLRWE